MKPHFTLYSLFFLASLVCGLTLSGQEKKDSVPVVTPNAGFDVIIMRNGDLVYGLVQEVGEEWIRYKRTDIPDGPIYTLRRWEVYAISYRNQVKDILNPFDGWGLGNTHGDSLLISDFSPLPLLPEKAAFSLTNEARVRLALGFLRGYTKVKNTADYKSAFLFPVVSVGYDVVYRPNLRLGVQAAFGSHKFSKQEYNAYDSLQVNTTLKENIFSAHVYGYYSIGSSVARLRPYLMGGLGLQTSFIRTRQELRFLERFDQVLEVSGGSRSVGLGLLLRGGAGYVVNRQIRVFADVGTGPAIIQVGVSALVN